MYSTAHGYKPDELFSTISLINSTARFDKHGLPVINAATTKKAVSAAIDPTLLDLLQDSARTTAYLMNSGEAPGLKISREPVAFLESGPGNETKFNAHWWGYQLYLDSATANRIAADLTVGSGAAAIVVLLGGLVGGPMGAPIAVLFAAAAALMTIGLGVILAANAAGRGIILQGIWVPPLFVLQSQ